MQRNRPPSIHSLRARLRVGWLDLRRSIFLAPLLVLCLLCFPRTGNAQAAWEFTPYRVHIWLALPDDPTWEDAQLAQIKSTLLGRAETTFGPVWACEVDRPPAALAGELGHRLEDLTAEEVKAAVPKGFAADKIYLVAVSDDHGLLTIRVRELDYRARQFGVVLERQTPQRDGVAWQIWDAVARAFTPLARVERVEGPTITARIRAGGLINSETSAAWIRPDAVLRPITRRNDRTGEPMKGGIHLVPWTMLEVKEQTDSLLTCKLHSGYRGPIPSKGSSRLERLALLVQPQFPSTTLHLRSRDKSAQPLAGYEIWRKLSDTDGELLGSTDWRGNIELPRAETGVLQTLLVRSGGQLLARLPLVPGQQPLMEAALVNDDGRLQAEGFVTSFQSKVMDLEARRQIAAVRIRKTIKDGKLDDAQLLLEQFRELETRNDLAKLLQQQSIKSTDPTTQKRIDKLLIDARGLLTKFLDPELGTTLQRELAAAKAPKPAPPAAIAAPKPAPAPSPTPMPAAPSETTTP